MDLLPHWYVFGVVVVLGLIMGSFLDVIVSRFHTGKSLNGRSRCMSCGHQLSWYELFPLLSYMVLRGRCRVCGAKIPMRLFWMEIATAAIFGYVFLLSETILALFFGLALVCVLIIVAAYDMRHMVIPHEFVFMLLFFAAAALSYEVYTGAHVTHLLVHAFGALGASAFFGLLWLASKGKWIGLGDAKLAFPLALMLPPLSTLSMVILSFWIGAGVSVVLLLFQRALASGQRHLSFTQVPLTMKSEVPFAPFLIAAFIVVYFQHIEVLSLLSELFY